MIRTVLIDDEPGNIITLTQMLNSYCPAVELCGTAENIREGEALINRENPHLVFLDIEMPFGNAFDLLDKMMPVRFEVIFITAFNNYAIQAFKYSALDYILKPVNIEDLKKAVQRVEDRLMEKTVNLRIESLIGNLKGDAQAIKKIALPTVTGLSFEPIDQITRIEAEGNSTIVILKNGKRKPVSKNLKDFEDMLTDGSFFRIHNSHIININYVKKYYKGRGGYVEMEDGTTVVVSTRKKDEFLEKFKF